MAVTGRPVEYEHDGDILEGYFAFDDAGSTPAPAVLIAHAWGGRDEFVCEKARRVAALGYPAFALDMYGRGVLGSGVEENSALMQPFIDDRVHLQSRIARALETMRAQECVDASRVAATGFCFGGLCVLDLARSGANLSGVVSFHGLFAPPGNTAGNRIHPRVLLLHGEDDPMVPESEIQGIRQELTAAGCDWQLHVFGGTLHAFTNPAANDPQLGTVYSESADRRSWVLFTSFLQEVFGS